MNTDNNSMKSVGRIAFAIILIIAIIVIAIRFMWTHKHIQQMTKNSIILSISPNEWTWVETEGKEFESEIIPIDGVKPKYLISVNNTKHPKVQPLPTETKLGEAKTIKKLYYKLVPGQEYTNAEIKFVLK